MDQQEIGPEQRLELALMNIAGVIAEVKLTKREHVQLDQDLQLIKAKVAPEKDVEADA